MLLIRRQSEWKRRCTGRVPDTDAEPAVVEPELDTHLVSGPAAVRDRVRNELAGDEQRLETPTALDPSVTKRPVKQRPCDGLNVARLVVGFDDVVPGERVSAFGRGFGG